MGKKGRQVEIIGSNIRKRVRRREAVTEDVAVQCGKEKGKRIKMGYK